MTRKQKKIAKGIYLCDGSVFFRVMVDGKRQMRKANLQGALSCISVRWTTVPTFM